MEGEGIEGAEALSYASVTSVVRSSCEYGSSRERPLRKSVSRSASVTSEHAAWAVDWRMERMNKTGATCQRVVQVRRAIAKMECSMIESSGGQREDEKMKLKAELGGGRWDGG